MTVIYKTLYHRDNNDNLRTWFMERDGSMYRTHSGIQGGKIVVSDWKQANAKNVGKTNATTDESQADAEVEAIYQKKLDRKYSYSPETAAKSNFVQPMLADKFHETKTLKTKKRWYLQPKFDGVRCVIDDNGGTSRAGKPFYTVEHIVNLLQEASLKYNVTFDGELYNHGYKEDFEKIVSLIKKQKLASLTGEELQEIRDKVQFHIYDIIFWDDLDKTYEERLEYLRKIFVEDLGDVGDVVQLCKTVLIDNLDMMQVSAAHDNFFIQGYEGLMLRDPDSVYAFKRTKGLLKYKNFDEGEFELVDIIEGQGNWSGAAKAVIVRLADGTTSEAGVAGTYERNVNILERKKEFIGGEVTIKYQGFTKDKKLRFGVVKAFHEGKRDY